MKFKTTWILIAVFAALGAYFYFVEEPSHRAEQKAKEQEGLLFPGFEPDRVTEVTIEGEGRKVRAKKGEGGRWLLAEPVEDRADDARIRSLLSSLKELKTDREIDGAGADLQKYGLDKPRAVLSTQGAAVSLAIGSENPAGDARYIRAGSGPVRIAKSYGLSSLLVEAKDLRSKDLLDSFPWSKLQSVELRSTGAAPLRLEKKDDRWRLAAPRSAEADQEAVDALMEKLRWARATSIVERDPKEIERNLAQGIGVTLQAEGDPKPETVRLAKVGDEVWAAAGNRKAVLALGNDVYESLRVNPRDLERRKPVLTKAWSAERVEVSATGKSFDYKTEEGSWRRGSKPLEGAEASALREFLSGLENAKATEVIDAPGDPGRYGLSPPRITVKLFDSRHKEQTLALGETQGKVYARSGGTGPVYAMAPEYLANAEALVKAAEAAKPADPKASPSVP